MSSLRKDIKMQSTFRSFKRHYHKIKSILKELGESGSFSLRLSFDGDRLKAQSTTPSEEDTTRFVVLMRRFLDPADSLYYNNVWQQLRQQYEDIIPSNVIDHIENAITQLRTGYIGITLNTETLTAEQIYLILADGEYFNVKEELRTQIQAMLETQPFAEFFWHNFRSYNLQAYDVVSSIFNVMLEIERLTFDDMSSQKILNRCIFCLETNSTFDSEEHIFPESLGNDELVLPKGYVCLRCNNDILSDLDDFLINFDPIAFLRVQFVPYTKAGKLPKANFQNMALHRTGPRNITMTAKDKTAEIKKTEDLGNDWYKYSFQMKGRKMKTGWQKTLGRSLYKIALGTLALSRGIDVASDKRYDPARSFIRGEQGFPNNLLMRMEIIPHPQIGVAHMSLDEGTPFEVDIFGITFILNLEPTPEITPNDMLKQLAFESFSLH